MLLIAILILIIDREYPLYFSPRIGKNNTDFLMPKFRTMSSNAPQVPTHLLSNPGDYILSTGPFLRKYSLDELPQLLNIFKGEMNFLGPRPALYNQDDLINLRKKLGIIVLKPGLTGWAQIHGRDMISIKEKVNLDKYYLDNKSIYLDCKILTLTIKKVMFSDDILS